MVSHLNIYVWKWSKIAAKKKVIFFADFALQNMMETMLPDGLETSGRRAYHKFWYIYSYSIEKIPQTGDKASLDRCGY